MWPERVSNSGPLALKSNALLTVLHGPAYHKPGIEAGTFDS